MLVVTGFTMALTPVPPAATSAGPALPARLWQLRPVPAPWMPRLPVMAARVIKACEVLDPLLMRVVAPPQMTMVGLVVAYSMASARIFSGGTPQMLLAQAGVLGTPS